MRDDTDLVHLAVSEIHQNKKTQHLLLQLLGSEKGKTKNIVSERAPLDISSSIGYGIANRFLLHGNDTPSPRRTFFSQSCFGIVKQFHTLIRFYSSHLTDYLT